MQHRGSPYRIDLFHAMLFVLFVFTLGRVHQRMGFVVHLRPAMLLVAGCFLVAALQPASIRLRNLVDSWPARVLVALAIVACLSAPFGLSLGSTGRFILDTYSRVLVFAALLIVGIRRVGDLRLLVYAYVASVVGLVWIAASSGMVQYEIARLDFGESYDGNDLGVILVTGIPIVMTLLHTTGRWGKLFAVALLVATAAVIARTGSRGAFVGVVALVIAMVWLLDTVALPRRIIAVAVVALGLVVAAPEGYWQRMREISDPTQDYNWTAPSGRILLWKRGLGYMVNHPVLGIGAGNFPRAEGLISDLAQRQTAVKWSTAHNSFIEIGAELGVPGLLLWSSLVFGGAVAVRRLHTRIPRQWRRSHDRDERFVYHFTLYLPIAFVGFAATASFVSFAYVSLVYILTAYVIGCLLVTRQLCERSPEVVATPSVATVHAERGGRAVAVPVGVSLTVPTAIRRSHAP